MRDQPDHARQARLDQALQALPPATIRLQPVAAENADDCRLWRACELCIYLDYRSETPPDPRDLSDADILDWSRRGLAADESLGDPADMPWYRPYWLQASGRRIGILALALQASDWDRTALGIASLYLLPGERRQGHATRLFANLYQIARDLGLLGLQLDVDWVWQPAVRCYLRNGFSVRHWKRDLRLERRCAEPGYEVRFASDRAEYRREGDAASIILARHGGDWLEWQTHPRPDVDLLHPSATLALWLAVAGWPLIRSPETWAERSRWCDVGMPEGLAQRITVLEAYTRHCGFPVRTPRIPGLVYPNWDSFQVQDPVPADRSQT